VCSSCASTPCEFKTSATGARSSWAVGLQRSLLRSTSAKAQTVLGLDETSAAHTSSARVSHAMADTIDTSSAAVQGRGCMKMGINTTSSGGTCIHSVRILGPYARCTAKKISLERAAQLSFLKSCLLRIFVDANWSAHQLVLSIIGKCTTFVTTCDTVRSTQSAKQVTSIHGPWTRLCHENV
jgi:hypothetical protein